MAVCQTSNANHFTWRGDIPQRPGMTRGVFECADGGWVTLNVSPDKVRAFLAWVEEEGIETDVAADAILIQTRGTLLLPEMLDLSAQLAARLKREDFMEKAWALDMMSLPVMDFPDLAECEHLEVTDQFFTVWDDPLSASLGLLPQPGRRLPGADQRHQGAAAGRAHGGGLRRARHRNGGARDPWN